MKISLLLLSLAVFGCSKTDSQQLASPKSKCQKPKGSALVQMNLNEKPETTLGTQFSASESSTILSILPSALNHIPSIFCKEKDSTFSCSAPFVKVKLTGKDAESIYQIVVKYGEPLYAVLDSKPGLPPKQGPLESYVLDGIHCEKSICSYGSTPPSGEAKQEFPNKDEKDGATTADDVEVADPVRDRATGGEPSEPSSSDSTKCI